MARQLTPRPARSVRWDRGFSLIELLVVIAVLSTLVVSVQIALPSGSPAHVQDRATLARMVRAMRHKAVLSERPTGITLDRGRIQGLVFAQGDWQLLGRAQRLRGNVVLLGETDDAFHDRSGGRVRPDIVFAPNGDVDQFRLILRSRGQGVGGSNRDLTCTPDLQEGMTCS